MFLFKKKKVILNCYTYRSDVFAYFPIEKATKSFPNWWKELPNSYSPDGLQEVGTMKGCAGFTSYYQNAISLPLWSDCIIKASESEKSFEWAFSDHATEVSPHSPEQIGNYLRDGNSTYAQMKIISPWALHCDEEINFVFSGNPWAMSNPERVIIPPGVVNYKYQFVTNINLFLRVIGDQTTKLDAGSSLIHIFPMTEREVEIRSHFVDKKEWNALTELGTRNFSLKTYYKHRQVLKDREKAGTCPMSSILKR